jgi:hypothetical protein
MDHLDDEEDEMETLLRKVVINTCTGGFSLSHQAFIRLREMGQTEALQEHDAGGYWPSGSRPDEPSLNRCGVRIPRDDEKLVRIVEELGSSANGHCADLKVIEIPHGMVWEIESVHGVERLRETHRSWD